MSPSDQDYGKDVQRLAEASLWRVRLSEADLESSAALEAWLAADPANLIAWKRVQVSWGIPKDFTVGPELMAARRDALDRAGRAGGRRWRGWHRSWPWAVEGLIAAALTSIVFAMILAGRAEVSLHYQTGLSRHEVVTLPDGSRAILDAATQLDVRYFRRARRIHLLRGQARFEVAHDSARPFTVRAGNQTVLAVGTDFNVSLVGHSVLIALIQGRVLVAANDRTDAPLVTLSPGQELVASTSEPPRIQAVSANSVTAWETGHLIFHDESLASVVATVSRYGEHPLVADGDIASLRISGVFEEGDIPTFVDVITHYMPITAQRLPDGTIVFHRKR